MIECIQYITSCPSHLQDPTTFDGLYLEKALEHATSTHTAIKEWLK
jgi:hypothetical protein